jgi:tetratricopeptide (TPR) repeat protein
MQALFWVQYFPDQIMDGFGVFMDTKNYFEVLQKRDAVFQRLCPNSEAAGQFAMDELDIDAMLNAVHNERLNDPVYLQNILATALVVAARKAESKQLDSYSELASAVITWSHQTQQPETGFNIAKSWLKLVQKVDETSDHLTNAMLFRGLSLYYLTRYPEAIDSLKGCLEILKKRPAEDLKIRVLYALGECDFMLSTYTSALEYHQQSLSLKRTKHGGGTTTGKTLAPSVSSVP